MRSMKGARMGDVARNGGKRRHKELSVKSVKRRIYVGVNIFYIT